MSEELIWMTAACVASHVIFFWYLYKGAKR